MKPGTDSPGIIFPPPLVYVIFAFIGGLLNNIFPLGLGIEAPLNLWLAGIFILLLAGFMIYMEVLFLLKKTNPFPWKPANALITDGPYAWSRNPIYVAMILIHVAGAFYYNSFWPLFTAVFTVAIMNRFIIPREEKHLEAKFGTEYINYKSRVNRWI